MRENKLVHTDLQQCGYVTVQATVYSPVQCGERIGGGGGAPEVGGWFADYHVVRTGNGHFLRSIYRTDKISLYQIKFFFYDTSTVA
jgi:hypothetical protein